MSNCWNWIVCNLENVYCDIFLNDCYCVNSHLCSWNLTLFACYTNPKTKITNEGVYWGMFRFLENSCAVARKTFSSLQCSTCHRLTSHLQSLGHTLTFHLGSVYFIAKMTAATNRPELFCRQSNIRLMAWHNTKKKVTLSGTRCPARGVIVKCYGCYANGCRFDSPSLFFFVFFQALLRCYLYGLVLLY